ncbi:MAG TPA: ABC transporter permease [Candidatus Aquilonibacter sp.]|nr:ABC transporter permease [Candidatus Aquilonibacter sp.]
MSSSALSIPYTANSARRIVAIFARETRYEFVRAMRTKAFSLSVVGFPVMFYLLFGVMNRGEALHGQMVAKYLLASYAAFGVVGAALFGIGVGLAGERVSGWLELKRASPMPPLAYLTAKCVASVAFGLIITNILCVIGVFAASVPLSVGNYVSICAVSVAGGIPFACFGLLLAMVLPANSAPAVVNLIYLPMSYFSGLWIPISLLPKWIQHFAPWLPTYHLAQLMLWVMGYASSADGIRHIFALFGYTSLFLGAAWMAFARADADA